MAAALSLHVILSRTTRNVLFMNNKTGFKGTCSSFEPRNKQKKAYRCSASIASSTSLA